MNTFLNRVTVASLAALAVLSLVDCVPASAQNQGAPVVISQPSVIQPSVIQPSMNHSSMNRSGMSPGAAGGSYYCAKCGKYHTRSAAVAATGLRGGGGVQNVLATLNAQRARQGVGSLRYDPVLQAVAARRAQMMASRNLKTHPPGSYAPGTYEGVGWSSSYSPSGVSACFTSDARMQVAGAAMATGSDGVYFAVVYR